MTHALGRREVLRSATELLLYAVTGALAGGVATAMITAAGAYASLLTLLTTGVPAEDISYLGHTTPALAALAGLSSLAALALALLAPEAMGASIDELLDEYHHRAAEASPRGLAVKLAATPVAVGGGAPVGILGPVVYVGGSVEALHGRDCRSCLLGTEGSPGRRVLRFRDPLP